MSSSLSQAAGRTAPPPNLPGIERVTSLKILGVTVKNKLSVSEHVRQIVSRCVQSFHALRIIRNHGTEVNTRQLVSPSWQDDLCSQCLVLVGIYGGCWQAASWGINILHLEYSKLFVFHYHFHYHLRRFHLLTAYFFHCNVSDGIHEYSSNRYDTRSSTREANFSSSAALLKTQPPPRTLHR